VVVWPSNLRIRSGSVVAVAAPSDPVKARGAGIQGQANDPG
jgi:hypothetical protein